jgi:GTP-binding protein
MPLKLAIVGRPNVGKSTLFNRLAGKKLAIVDDQPGVTRDRRFATGRLGDLDLDLIDTAGFEDVTDESLESRMRAQTELAIEEADVSLLRDRRPRGRDAAGRSLRRNPAQARQAGAGRRQQGRGQAGRPVGHRRGPSLGLGEPIPISGEHGEGMAELYAALPRPSPEDQCDRDEDDDDKPIRSPSSAVRTPASPP